MSKKSNHQTFSDNLKYRKINKHSSEYKRKVDNDNYISLKIDPLGPLKSINEIMDELKISQIKKNQFEKQVVNELEINSSSLNIKLNENENDIHDKKEKNSNNHHLDTKQSKDLKSYFLSNPEIDKLIKESKQLKSNNQNENNKIYNFQFEKQRIQLKINKQITENDNYYNQFSQKLYNYVIDPSKKSKTYFNVLKNYDYNSKIDLSIYSEATQSINGEKLVCDMILLLMKENHKQLSYNNISINNLIYYFSIQICLNSILDSINSSFEAKINNIGEKIIYELGNYENFKYRLDLEGIKLMKSMYNDKKIIIQKEKEIFSLESEHVKSIVEKIYSSSNNQLSNHPYSTIIEYDSIDNHPIFNEISFKSILSKEYQILRKEMNTFLLEEKKKEELLLRKEYELKARKNKSLSRLCYQSSDCNISGLYERRFVDVMSDYLSCWE